MNPNCFLTVIRRFVVGIKASTGFIKGTRVHRNYFHCEESRLTSENFFSKFLNPGVTKSTPFFSKIARKDHAIARFLDVITHRSRETK